MSKSKRESSSVGISPDRNMVREHPRESASIRFLSCVEILFCGSSQGFGPATRALVSVRKHMLWRRGVERDPQWFEPHRPDPRESASSPLLIRAKILTKGQSSPFGLAKNFSADKQRRLRGFTRMLSNDVPGGIPLDDGSPSFSDKMIPDRHLKLTYDD